MILVNRISKSFDAQKILDDITLKLKVGEIHALAGINGAGKSTLIRIIANLVQPDSGSVVIKNITMGTDEVTWRKYTRFVFDKPELIEDYYVIEQIRFCGFLQNITDSEARIRGHTMCKLFDIPPQKRISDLSMGQKIKLSLLNSLLSPLEYWILDEPFVHLDFASRHRLMQIIVALKSNGTTILITSHEIDILRSLPDHIHLLKDHRLSTMDPILIKKHTEEDSLINVLLDTNLNDFDVENVLPWLFNSA